ncbi:MAG TPA: S1/P1 nuclease [Steroidobacteraceae bacterium]|nr:S1/P1 nuclease [Steroidobacteraceae bacterium]
MRARLCGVLLMAIVALSSPPSSQAWGSPGHRITGYIANSLLTHDARAQLKILVGSDDVSLLTTWMDDERESLERQRPGTSRWHYENRTICGVFNRDCPRGDCITEQIERHRAILADVRASRVERATAVRVLAHLIGDMHQPLHIADNKDRGGNDTYVELPREKNARRLHEAWDVSFVKLNVGRRSEANFAHDLIRKHAGARASWERGTLDEWAQETYALGKRFGYESLPAFACANSNAPNSPRSNPQGPIVLSAEYIAAARSTVETQLAAAGVRLAKVLNEALASDGP